MEQTAAGKLRGKGRLLRSLRGPIFPRLRDHLRLIWIRRWPLTSAIRPLFPCGSPATP